MKSKMIIVVVTILSGIYFASATVGVVQDRQASFEKKIVELKKKRRDILKQRVDSLQQQVDSGQMAATKVISAREDFYQAELELTTVKAERVKLSEQRFKNMIKLEKIAAQRFENGIGPFEEKLAATAARLQAEIDFLREQAAPN